jgi:hypothetical protein
MPDPLPQPDPRRTLLRAVAILVLLVIAMIGLCYSGWMLWTLPAKPG